MGGGMTPDVIAAATNMINNLNPMAVLQVSRMMTVVITLFDKNDDQGDGITHNDQNLMLLLVIWKCSVGSHLLFPDDWRHSTWGRGDAKHGS